MYVCERDEMDGSINGVWGETIKGVGARLGEEWGEKEILNTTPHTMD